MTDLRKLFDTMTQIDEAYNDDENHSFNDEDDRPKASEIGLSKDFKDHGYSDDDHTDAPYNKFDADYEDTLAGIDPHKSDWKMRGGEDGLGIDGDSRHDRKDDDLGDDPWGIGEDSDDGASVPDDIQLKEDVREITNKVHGAMDDQMLDPRTVAEAALAYLSEDDVAEMARMNGWFEYEDDDDEYIIPDDDYDEDYIIPNEGVATTGVRG